MNPQHLAVTNRWGTPEDIIERARRCMGGITLDPCSEERFNEVVKAEQYYSLLERGEDGLVLPWHGKVLLNPPGDTRKGRLGLVRKFWEKMLTEEIEQCVYIGFSMEQLGQLADASAHPSDFSICYLRQRIHFNRHDNKNGSPSHSNFVAGVSVDHAAFVREFGELGKIQKGPLAR